MDMITLAMAKAYTDSQQLARVENAATVIIPETKVTVIDGYAPEFYDRDIPLPNGQECIVIFDGVKYPCTATIYHGPMWYAGNGALCGEGEDNGLPFCIAYEKIHTSLMATVSGEHTVYMEIPEKVKTIDPKFLPGVTINLPDYGIDIWAFLGLGTGTHTLTVEGATLFEKVPSFGGDLTLVNDNGTQYPVTITKPTVGYNPTDGFAAQIGFSMTAYRNAIIKADVILLNNGGAETTVIAAIDIKPIS